MITCNQHYVHYIHDNRLLSIYTRIRLKANMLYIETKYRIGIGLKITTLLLKIKPGIGLKIGHISPKNSVSLIRAIQFV
jgi:hypothetical protein